MKKRVWILTTIVLLSISVFSHGAIEYINATDLNTQFDPVGGDFSLGVLTISDIADIVVEETGGMQNTFDDGSFNLITSLWADNSGGGIAQGQFVGGILEFLDSSNAGLLTGNVLSLNIIELFDNSGILAGSGLFEVTGGSLEADFTESFGEIVQITFQVNPASIDNFSSRFTGVSNITVTPIPEPATILMLGLGALALIRKK